MAKIIIYGIPNCDTVKKTLNWFKSKNINVNFHDYKRSGIAAEKLQLWIDKAGLQTVLNKASVTWKNLSVEEQLSASDTASAIIIMMENTSIIKRPIIEFGDQILIGFNQKIVEDAFKRTSKLVD